MSSPNEIDSLSGLAEAAKKLEKFLKGTTALDPKTFEEFKELINVMQVCCPNHAGVLAARLKWYRLALEAFEKRVVQTLESGRQLGKFWSPDPSTDPEILCSPEVLEAFMRRNYLKSSFAEFYTRLQRLLNRAAVACENHPNSARTTGPFVGIFKTLATRLNEAMLHGKV